jgi:hypothetical protein
MSVDLHDFIYLRQLSDCCGAPMLEGGFCSACRERATCTQDEPVANKQDELSRLDRVRRRTHTIPHEL